MLHSHSIRTVVRTKTTPQNPQNMSPLISQHKVHMTRALRTLLGVDPSAGSMFDHNNTHAGSMEGGVMDSASSSSDEEDGGSEHGNNTMNDGQYDGQYNGEGDTSAQGVGMGCASVAAAAAASGIPQRMCVFLCFCVC